MWYKDVFKLGDPRLHETKNSRNFFGLFPFRKNSGITAPLRIRGTAWRDSCFREQALVEFQIQIINLGGFGLDTGR